MPQSKIGLIPAAGMARRLAKIGITEIKELILYMGKPIICYAIDDLVKANVDTIIVIIRKGKEPLVDFIKRKYSEENIKFIYQTGYIGNVIDAINSAEKEIEGKRVLFRLGDTYIKPNPFLKSEKNSADITLLCFISSKKECKLYGVIDEDKKQVIDKPKNYISNICWGALEWSPKFYKFIKNENDFTKAINKSSFTWTINIDEYVDIGTEILENRTILK